MDTLQNTMARQISEVASAFQLQRTGHAPQSVTVVFGDDTLVITLHGALSPAEKIMAQSAAGAALVQEYHRQLFAGSSDSLRQEIKRITGLNVQESAAEVVPASGIMIHAFTTGTMVQVFQLAKGSLTGALAAPGGAATLTHVNHVNHVNHEPGKSAGAISHKAKEESPVRP